MIVGLPELKQHLRVDGDHENYLIESIGRAAEQQVRDWIGRPFYESEALMPAEGSANFDPHQIVANSLITVSIKMLADRMYNNRGGEGMDAEAAVPPMSVRALLAGLRVFHRMPAPSTEAQVDSNG